MATFARKTRVAAPLEAVWEFHATIEGLEGLTPGWLHLDVQGVYGPDGEPNPESLLAGSVVRLSVQPFGVGPRQSWTSRITRREERPGAALFEDVMIGGPFRTWNHTHAFYADGEETVVRDRVEYELPVGPFGSIVDPLAGVPMDVFFRYRQRRLRELLEAPTVKPRT